MLTQRPSYVSRCGFYRLSLHRESQFYVKVDVLQESDAFALGSRFYLWHNNSLGAAPAQSLCFYPQLQSEHELTASLHRRTAYTVVVAC